MPGLEILNFQVISATVKGLDRHPFAFPYPLQFFLFPLLYTSLSLTRFNLSSFLHNGR